MIEKEYPEDYEVYNFNDSGIGESWMIGNDSSVIANAFINGSSACPESIIVPRRLTNKEGVTKPVEVVGYRAYDRCSYPSQGSNTKTVFITRQVKFIKTWGFGGMQNVESFQIEEGSVLESIEQESLYDIGKNTGANDANIRGTLTLPSTLSSVAYNGIRYCNLFKTIIYCGTYSLTNTCELEWYLNEKTKVKVTNQYSGSTIFNRTALKDSPSEVQSSCSKMEMRPTPSRSPSSSPSISPSPSATSTLGFRVNATDGGCEVIGWSRGGERCPDSLFIPETVDGLTVVAVREKAFENCTTRGAIVLPPTIQRIGARAFAGTENVAGVYFFGKKLLGEIGECAFWRCGINSAGFVLVLPSGGSLTVSEGAFSESGVEDLVFK